MKVANVLTVMLVLTVGSAHAMQNAPTAQANTIIQPFQIQVKTTPAAKAILLEDNRRAEIDFQLDGDFGGDPQTPFAGESLYFGPDGGTALTHDYNVDQLLAAKKVRGEFTYIEITGATEPGLNMYNTIFCDADNGLIDAKQVSTAPRVINILCKALSEI